MNKTSLPVRRHGVVTFVEPESVDSRIKTLVRTGTNAVIARVVAEQAAEQQALRDEGVKQEIAIRERTLTESLAAVATVKTAAGPSNAPGEVTVPVVFAEGTIEQLRAFATENELVIDPKLTLKGDIAKAVRTAYEAKIKGQ